MRYSFLIALFFFSGVAGLGYEILWTRMLSVALGHEIISMLAVVSAFFAGLALGAWCLDGLVSKSRSPGRWYVFFELGIGLWGVALYFLIPALNERVIAFIGVAPTALRHWSIAFGYPFLVLLPATFAMGATLPAMDRFLGHRLHRNHGVAGLYSVNTLGAMAGTLLVTFVFLPAWGLSGSSFILASINGLVALGMFVLTLQGSDAFSTRAQEAHLPLSLPIGLVLVLTGFLGVGFEVVMVRVLSQLFENTVYSFAVILETYLFATAVGAGIYQRMHRRKEKKELLSTLLLCTATCTLVAVYSLRYADVLFSLVKQAYGQNFIGALGAEMTLALLYFFLPTAAMGATFSHLAQSLKGEKNGVGRALCLNTVGGAFAPLVFGMFLLPRVGLLIPLLLIPAVYTLAMLFARIRPLAFAGIMLCLLALMVDQDKGAYQFVRMEKGHRLLAYREGVMASVSVIQDRHDGVHLKVNNHFQMGGTTSIFSDRRQAYLPLLLHKDPQKALFLGVGSGATFAAAADFPNLQATGVELVPEVVEVLSHFAKVNKSIDLSKRLKVVSADARRYVTTTQERYDVIVADLFHPARDGAGGLYTQEHFRAIRDRLSDDGLFCQWLPFYQLDLSLFKVIATTFLDVFPDGKAFLAHYSIEQPMIGLIGGKAPLLYPENWYIKRMHSKRFQRLMAGFGYDSVYSLLGTFLAGSRQLGQFVQGSAINTDVNPVVSFQAPLFVYEKQQPARERLVQLLDAFSPPPPDAILSKVVTEEDYLARERFPAYWNARDSFLRLGMEVQRTDNVVQLYKTASEPLLRVVRQSTDFSAAYYPLVSIAYELYPYDRDGSYQLLRKLERANPLRPEAPLLRQKLFSRHKPGEKKMGLPF